MAANLFTFLFNTLRSRINDPHNREYWLPAKLEGLKESNGRPLLPLQGESWNLGQVQDATVLETFKDQWWLFLDHSHKNDSTFEDELSRHKPIPTPDEPWPRLDFSKATVFGLDNLFLLDSPLVDVSAAGYGTTMTLELGYYNGQNDLPDLKPLGVDEGQYSLRQSLCSAAATGGASCDGWVADEVHGTGNVTAAMTGAYLDAEIAVLVDGTGSARILTLLVKKVTVRGDQGQVPGLTVKNLTLESKLFIARALWLPSAKKALESEDGREALIQNINATLNQAHTLQVLSEMLAERFNHILDSTLGTVSPGQLPVSSTPVANAADQYLFDRLRLGLNNPAGDLYLPNLVKQSRNPCLEPYVIDSLPLGNYSSDGVSLEDLTLSQVTITGFSNITAPVESLVLNETGAAGEWVLSSLKITGKFATKLMGEQTPGGSFTIEIGTARVESSLVAGGEDISSLELTLQKLLLSKPSDFKFELSIDSTFKDLINGVVNQDSVKKALVQKINEAVSGHMAEISTDLTGQVRRLVAARLGG